MKVNQVAHIWPKLSPVRSPLVGKRWSINSITRIFNSSANMTGMSSIRSWTALTFVGILPTYLNFYNRERFERTVRNEFGKLIWALPSFWRKMRDGLRIRASPLLITVLTSASLRSSQDYYSQQVKFRPSVPGSLQCFQAVDAPLGSSVTPFVRQRGNHRRAVTLDSRRQALHFRNPAL